MTYYHVCVTHTPSKNESIQVYEIDLTKEELLDKIVNPYLNGQVFICGGQTINPFSVNIIRVSESDEPSDKIVTWFKQKKQDIVTLGIRALDLDKFYIVENTKNVTRNFITRPPRKELTAEKKKIESNDIFIVHGRDHKPVQELKLMLHELGLNPIVLHEQASGSLTIVEKLEKYSDVNYAFVILTPDDVGGTESDFLNAVRALERLDLEDIYEDYMYHRARQNVVLEFGYFMGLLGRDKVCCLYKGDIELPSDMHGIVYVPFKESVNEQRIKIMRELREAGYEIKI